MTTEEPIQPRLRLYGDITPERGAMPAPYSELIRATDLIMKTVSEAVAAVIAEVYDDAQEKSMPSRRRSSVSKSG
jgi:hypothetical protein